MGANNTKLKYSYKHSYIIETIYRIKLKISENILTRMCISYTYKSTCMQRMQFFLLKSGYNPLKSEISNNYFLNGEKLYQVYQIFAPNSRQI